MKKVLAFDVYGTLIDTTNTRILLSEFAGDRAEFMTEMWRNKQLEYSFRQSAMGFYKGFSFCTQTALDYTCKYYDVVLSDEQKQALLESYNKLPVFSDTIDSLKELSNIDKYVFSNGEFDVLQKLLKHNVIDHYFKEIISVEETHNFKPSGEVYSHLQSICKLEKENIYLVSSNPFDIIGATYYGLKSIWIKRSDKTIFDEWGIHPTHTIESLTDIIKTI